MGSCVCKMSFPIYISQNQFITTNVVSSNPAHGEVFSMQHSVINVSDLRQVGYFPRVLRFPPPIKLTATI